MARNKYPEETKAKILNAAYDLFVRQGYENTSIQNIIDETKLSKGAVYHHFESKESILMEVFKNITRDITQRSEDLVNSKEYNGLEKLQRLYLNVFDDEVQMKMINSLPNLLDNPQILALYLKNTIMIITPRYIKPIVEEGVRDKTIKCDNPNELSEALAVLANVWMNPLIYKFSSEGINKRLSTLDVLLSGFGIKLNKYIGE